MWWGDVEIVCELDCVFVGCIGFFVLLLIDLFDVVYVMYEKYFCVDIIVVGGNVVFFVEVLKF